jgi:hypothetical protein
VTLMLQDFGLRWIEISRNDLPWAGTANPNIGPAFKSGRHGDTAESKSRRRDRRHEKWIPAFAGMTIVRVRTEYTSFPAKAGIHCRQPRRLAPRL